MPRPTELVGSPPAAVEEALHRLGRNIRTARLRRNLRQTERAERMGVSGFDAGARTRSEAGAGPPAAER